LRQARTAGAGVAGAGAPVAAAPASDSAPTAAISSTIGRRGMVTGAVGVAVGIADPLFLSGIANAPDARRIPQRCGEHAACGDGGTEGARDATKMWGESSPFCPSHLFTRLISARQSNTLAPIPGETP